MNRFKNILLVLNPEGNDVATVSLAVSLARRNQSDLTLISIVEDLPPEAHMWVNALPSEGLFERVMPITQHLAYDFEKGCTGYQPCLDLDPSSDNGFD